MDSITAAGVELEFDPDKCTFQVTAPVGAITEIPDPIVVMFEPGIDVFDLVLSYNAHRRHWDAETKAKAVAAILRARPELSDRQIAQKTRTSHPFVGKTREELQRSGDVEMLSTSTDTLGRKQPRMRKKKAQSKNTTKATPVQTEVSTNPEPVELGAEKKPKAAEPMTATVTTATDIDVVFDRASIQDQGRFLDWLFVDGVFFKILQHAPRLLDELKQRGNHPLLDKKNKDNPPRESKPSNTFAKAIGVTNTDQINA